MTWGARVGVNYPFLGTRPDIGACEGVGTCAAVTPPLVIPPSDPAPAVALELTHTCATASNALTVRVQGDPRLPGARGQLRGRDARPESLRQ